MEILMPRTSHTHTVINLHGRGSNAREYRSEFLESEDSEGRDLATAFPSFKWIFPTAPYIRSKRFDETLSQWFDMWSTDDPCERADEQLEALRDSVHAITQVIQNEADVLGMDKIIVSGISQGAVVAFAAMFEMKTALCGCIGFSTWSGGKSRADQCNETPVFLAHCEDDETINVKFGQELGQDLQSIGMHVEWHSYSTGGHWINEPNGVDDVIQFLRRITRSSNDE